MLFRSHKKEPSYFPNIMEHHNSAITKLNKENLNRIFNIKQINESLSKSKYHRVNVFSAGKIRTLLPLRNENAEIFKVKLKHNPIYKKSRSSSRIIRTKIPDGNKIIKLKKFIADMNRLNKNESKNDGFDVTFGASDENINNI